jgi:hypothetical protein
MQRQDTACRIKARSYGSFLPTLTLLPHGEAQLADALDAETVVGAEVEDAGRDRAKPSCRRSWVF